MLNIEITKALHGTQGAMHLEVKLQIHQGEFVILMGESGSGKTTLLRILAGLENYEGRIEVFGESWNDKSLQTRQIGFVFQDYALFENMTVEENLLFVREDKALAASLLAMAELETLASRNVQTLSGGQKQRVSLCRALMLKPKLLLMDEPLSALDETMRVKLQAELAKLHKAFGMTTVMVSHHAEESYALADRIVVLDQGKMIKEGKKEMILEKKMTMTYGFIG